MATQPIFADLYARAIFENSIVFCPTLRRKEYLKPSDVVGAREHYSFYHNPENFKMINNDKLLGWQYIAWGEVKELTLPRQSLVGLDFLHPLLTNSHKDFGEVTAFNITAPETVDFGLTVVRIISEKGIPLWFGHSDLPLKKGVLRNQKLRREFMEIHPLG